MMNTGTAGRASSSSGCGTAPPTPLLLSSCCVCPSPTPGPALLCSGRRREVGCPGLALVAMPAGGGSCLPPARWGRGFPSPPTEQPRADEPSPHSSWTSRCVSFRKGLPKCPILLSLLPVSPPFDAFWHCMKQLCPEAMISMDACFNGDSSLAQLHPTSPIYPPASTAALRTPQPVSLQALSKAPATGQELGSQHSQGPSLCPMARAGAQPTSPGQGTSRCLRHLWPSRSIPQRRAEAGRLPCPCLLPKLRASTEIPNSKRLLGIEQLLSNYYLFNPPCSQRIPATTSQSPCSPRGMDAIATVPFHLGHPEM